MTVKEAKKLIPAGSHLEMDKLLEMDLDKDSVVVIIGLYKGVTAELIQTAYGCKIYGYDPQADMCKKARKRLNLDTQIFEYALGDKEGTFEMWEVGNDAASFYPGNSTRDPGKGPMRDVIKVFEKEGIDHIDLLLINCEGSEYTIIPRLLETGYIKNIKQMMLQFHKAATKGNGKEYARMLTEIAKAGFGVKWTIGSPWTWFVLEDSPIDPPEDVFPSTAPEEEEPPVYGIPEQEPSLSNEVVEEHKCPECDWTTTAKDYKRAYRRHQREEHN